MTEPDMINAPPHYRGADGLEAIEVLEAYDLGLHLGTAMAYLLRAGRKGDRLEDLRKARWWVARWLVVGDHFAPPRAFLAAKYECPPDRVIAAFDLRGPQATAVRLVLDAALLNVDKPWRSLVDVLDAAIDEHTQDAGVEVGA